MNPREFTDRYNEQAGVLMRKFGEGMKDGNIVFSPFSILSLLSLLTDATAGTTRREILDLLYGDFPRDGFPEQMEAFRKELIRKADHSSGWLDYEDPYYGKPVRDLSEHFHSANVVCVRDDLSDSIHPGFRKRLREMYNGELLSFANLKAALGAWLPEQVLELLPALESVISPETVMAMVNTVTFDAMWQYPYEDEDIEDGVFHNADGTVSAVNMLLGGTDSYVENEFGIGFLKEFQQCGYSFMALLPKEKGSECLKALALNMDFFDLLHHRKYAVVNTMMPEFSVSFGETLNGVLRDLGIREVFTDRADFSSISTVLLFADRMIHRAKIEVDRNGARAAAATALVMCTGLPPEDEKEILIDRPFVFAVVHEKLGIPVFAGVVNQI